MVIWMAARRVGSLCTPLLYRFYALRYPHPTQSLCLLVTPTPQILQVGRMIPCEVLLDESYKNLPDSFYHTALLSSGSAIRKCCVPWAFTC